MIPLQKHLKIFCLMCALAILCLAGLSSCDDDTNQNMIISDQSAGDIRILLVADPFSNAMKASEAEFHKALGAELDIDIVTYDVLYEMIKKNGQQALSSYDIISVDVVWLGEFKDQNLLLPLDEFIQQHQQELEIDDIMPAALEQGQINGKTYLIPLQPHSELLWYRKDLFQNAGIAPPTNTEELLKAAKAFHDPDNNMVGIAWNAHEGSPLGQTMAHLYAAFGQPELLDANGQPNLNTPAGLKAGEYILELKKYSSENILHMAWDQRISLFKNGRAAMTYGWGARANQINTDLLSKVQGKVDYLPAPAQPGEPSHTPLGTWSLAIPANIGEHRKRAEKALLVLSRYEGMKHMADHGNSAVSRMRLMRDADLQKRYPVLEVMVELSDNNLLDSRMRPQAPVWRDIEQALGTSFHAVLRGELTPEEGAALAQKKAIELTAARQNNVARP